MNLRSVIAQVYRGGRSIRSGQARNISSSPDSTNGSKGVSAGGGLNSSVTMSSAVGIVAFTLLGYACFIGKEVLEARKHYKEYKLRAQLHDELMSKAKRD